MDCSEKPDSIERVSLTSHIREITRKEIVSGEYGRVWVKLSSERGKAFVSMFNGTPATPDELEAAAIVLKQIAGVLREHSNG